MNDHKTDPDAPQPGSTVGHMPVTAAMTAVVSSLRLEQAGDQQSTPTLAGFELLDVVGKGGMGVVYRARDLSLNRDVAIKILKDGINSESSLSARFTDEARITGQLQHPAIPSVHQVARLSDGRPFLVMKLIKGQTLDQLLKDRPNVGHDRGRFIAVFETICQAVGYAHAHDVIHRDLKPHNIMVGAFGETQVMDWGLAKEMTEPSDPQIKKPVDDSRTRIHAPRGSDSSQTQAGSIMGTLAYMAPEQAAGEIAKVGPPADVFGLGAILCVILTGKPPYVGDDFEDVRLKAVRGNVEEAFVLLDRCGAEIEIIALAKRCLSPAMNGRPANGGEVAEAVATLRSESEQRVRKAEIEKARVEVQSIETRKRRRIQALLAAAAVGIVLMTGAGVWWSRVQAAAQEAQVKAQRELIDYEIASKLEQAEAALHKPNYSLVELDVLLRHADEKMKSSEQEELRNRFSQVLRHRRMLEVLDVIDDKRWSLDDSNLSVNIKMAKDGYPKAFEDWGINVVQNAVSASAQEISNAPIAQRLITALYAWAEVESPPQVFDILNRLDPDPERSAVRSAYAEKDSPKIKELTDKLDGRKLPTSFAQFVGGHPLTPRDQALPILQIAQSVHPDHFGLVSVLALRLPRENHDSQIAYARTAVALRPNNPNCHNNLGVALLRAGARDSAMLSFSNALALNPRMIVALYNVALVKLQKLDVEGGIADLREVIRMEPKYAQAHNLLGSALRDKGDVDGAMKEFQETVRLDPNHADAHGNIGQLLNSQQKFDEALAHYRKAAELSPNLAFSFIGIGDVLRGRKDHDGALKAYQEAARIDPTSAWAQNGIGNVHYDRKKYELAIIAYRAAVQLEPDQALLHSNLGYALMDSGKKDAAIAPFQKAVELKIQRVGPYIALSGLMQNRRNYKESLRVLKAGAEVNTDWVKDGSNKVRYNMARNAVLIAANLDDEALSETERVQLRDDAMNWMTEEVAAWMELVRSNATSKLQLHLLLQLILKDNEFESVRDVKKLPIKERAGWTNVWKEITRLRDETAPFKAPAKPKE